MAGKKLTKEFLNNLNKEIEAKGYSEEELLTRTGMDKKNLYPYLKGKKSISDGKIENMCVNLDISPEKVFYVSLETIKRVFRNSMNGNTSKDE